MRIFIGAPAGKNLADMKKQQNHTNWGQWILPQYAEC